VAPGGTPPAGPKSSGSPVKVILIVLAVVAVGGVGFLLLSGGGDEASADSPDGAVRAFFDAAGSADCEALQELVVDNDTASDILSTCQAAAESGEGFPAMTLHDVSVVDQGDTTATVSVDYTTEIFSGGGSMDEEPTTSVENERSTDEWALQMQDGTWRVDLDSLGG
jgi:hypothetical protein